MALIESVTKVRGGCRMVIGEETVTVSESIYRERPLQPGDEIDPDEYDEWLLLRQYRPALDYAVSLLAQRPHASGEIRERLERRGCRPRTVDMVLYKLSSNGLLDDGEFARQWAAARAGRNLGARRITQELRSKGFSDEEAAQAAAEIPEEDLLRAATGLARKGLNRAKPGEDPRRTVQRVMAMLARRGYSYDLSKKAIENARSSDEE